MEEHHLERTFIRCRKCGWVHLYDRSCPDAPWVCWRCRAEGKEAFESVKESETGAPTGVTIQPVNR